MQHRFAFLTLALGGCSLLYNPNNLPEPTGDAPIPDANGAQLMLTSASPDSIDEGRGDGGSQPGVLVIVGSNITPDATVTIAPTTPNNAVHFDVGAPLVQNDHDAIAVSVKSYVAPGVDVDVPLTITVTQAESTKTIPWTLHALPELMSFDPSGDAIADLYSRIEITTDLVVPVGQRAPIFRAVADAKFGAITADAMNQMGGAAPTTCNGGGPHVDGSCTGHGVAGDGGGGGGGLATAGEPGAGSSNSAGPMTGTPQIATYDSNPSAGGAGGQTGTLGQTGAIGGGGGGTVEVTAGGDVTVGAISAKGAAGASSGSSGGGGGGAGGVVVLRAGGTLVAGTVTNPGGAKGTGATGLIPTGPANGGKGSDGRVRWDAKSGSAPTGATSIHRGVMFDALASVVVDEAAPAMKLFGAAGDSYTLRVINAKNPADSTISFSGETLTIHPQLEQGYNRVCLLAPGGDLAHLEGVNCIDVAYIPLPAR